MTIYTWNTDSAESYHCTNWKKQVGQFLRFALNLQCAIDTIILGGKRNFSCCLCILSTYCYCLARYFIFLFLFLFFLIRKWEWEHTSFKNNYLKFTFHMQLVFVCWKCYEGHLIISNTIYPLTLFFFLNFKNTQHMILIV